MDKNDMMGMGDDGEMMEEGMPAEAPEKSEGMDKNTVMLSAEHFPKGMKITDGTKLTFCVEGMPDSEGNVSGYFENPEGGSMPKSDGWTNEFRKHMSPRSMQEGAS